MSSTSLGVAVIGAGMAGRSHAAGYRNATTVYGPGLPDVRLVAIADAYEPFATETARRFGYGRAETDWQALVDADDVDVVSVVVANHLHREIVEALLAAGKHVLCEKPLAPSVADAEAMVAAGEAAGQASGTVSATGFTFRRSPAIAGVADLAASGGIGAPVHLDVRYWCDYGVDPSRPMSWRYQGGPGSGALADIGSHVVDTAEFVGGSPIASVSGAVLHTVVTERALPAGAAVGHAAAELSDDVRPVENEDLVTFTARFVSGATASLTASRVAFGHANSLGFELFTERGAATFDLIRPGEIRVADATPSGPQAYRTVPIGPAHPYLTGGMPMDFPGVGYGQNDLFTFQARAFLEQVAGLKGLPPCPPLSAGLHNMRVLEAVVASAQAGGAQVAVPA